MIPLLERSVLCCCCWLALYDSYTRARGVTHVTADTHLLEGCRSHRHGCLTHPRHRVKKQVTANEPQGYPAAAQSQQPGNIEAHSQLPVFLARRNLKELTSLAGWRSLARVRGGKATSFEFLHARKTGNCERASMLPWSCECAAAG